MLGGEHMGVALHRPLIEAFGPDNPPVDATPALQTLMRHKRPRELAAIRESCAILTVATQALAEATRSGASVTAAILEAERVANCGGAQDVRTLFSLDATDTNPSTQ